MQKKYTTDNQMKVIGSAECTGCMLCKNICDVNAIDIKKGELGFYYPNINTDICIDCHKCEYNCIYITKTREKLTQDISFAMQASDETRKQSSSGGIFYTIAREFILTGGFVSGAIYSNGMIKHVVTNDLQELDKLCKSKYVQSTIDDMYKKIEELLKKDNKVLFTGTPCQCDAIKRYQKSNSKLYTIDILCMGVPSQDFFTRYLHESYEESPQDVIFRYKKNDIWSPTLYMKLLFNNSELIKNAKDDLFFNAFLNGVSIRQSCTSCQYAGTNREGDITLGDYWNIKSYDEKLDDERGTSLVLINTVKGKQLIDDCKEKIKLISEVPIEVAYKNNPILKAPIGDNYVRSNFKNKYSVTLVSNMKNDIFDESAECGIINYWESDDNGAILTAFALQRALDKMGHTSLLINTGSKRVPNGISEKFECEYLKSTLPYHGQEIKNANARFSTFIVGSDQVFRREWVPDSFFLNFADSNKKRIAVSASFGKDKLELDEAEKKEVTYWLKKFDALSCRELSGIDLFKKLKVNGVYIVDPVFWLEKEDYLSILNIVEKKNNSLVVYYRDLSVEIEKVINDIAAKNNWDVVVLNDSTDVREFVASILNAELVLTDSYHGVCFSMIMNTRFICTKNDMRGNARFDSLITIFGIEENVFMSIKELLLCDLYNLKYDWDEVNKKKEEEKKRAFNWMEKQLTRKKTVAPIIRAELYRMALFMNEYMDSKNKYYKFIITKKKADFVCYGAGKYGKKAIKLFGEKIDFFIDCNPDKKMLNGYAVFDLQHAKRIMNKETKIIISVSNSLLREISELLISNGFTNFEHIDSYFNSADLI